MDFIILYYYTIEKQNLKIIYDIINKGDISKKFSFKFLIITDSKKLIYNYMHFSWCSVCCEMESVHHKLRPTATELVPILSPAGK